MEYEMPAGYVRFRKRCEYYAYALNYTICLLCLNKIDYRQIYNITRALTFRVSVCAYALHECCAFFPIDASSGVLPSNNVLAIIRLIVEKLSLVIWFRKIRSRTMKSIDG